MNSEQCLLDSGLQLFCKADGLSYELSILGLHTATCWSGDRVRGWMWMGSVPSEMLCTHREINLHLPSSQQGTEMTKGFC